MSEDMAARIEQALHQPEFMWQCACCERVRAILRGTDE